MDNGHGRLIEQVDPIGKEVHYTYDANGRVLTVAAGTSGTFDPTEYVYDATTGLLDEVNYTSGTGKARPARGYPPKADNRPPVDRRGPIREIRG